MSASTDDRSVFPALAAPPQASRWPEVGAHLSAVSARAARLLLRSALALALPLAIFGLWWLATARQWLPEQILPTPAFVWESFEIVWDSGELRVQVQHSARRVAWSLLLGGGIGLVLGFALGLSATLRAYLLPTFRALTQIPVLGWIPLLIIFVGIEEALKLWAISLAVLLPVTLTTLDSITAIPRSLMEVGRVFAFSRWQTVTRIVLPATVPGLFSAVRQGVMQAWLTVIFVELLASSEGLGFFMAYSRALGQIDLVIVSMFVIGAIGLGIDAVLRLIESRLLGWRRSAY